MFKPITRFIVNINNQQSDLYAEVFVLTNQQKDGDTCTNFFRHQEEQ